MSEAVQRVTRGVPSGDRWPARFAEGVGLCLVDHVIVRGPRRSDLLSVGFLDLRALDVWGQSILRRGGRAVHRETSRSIRGLPPWDARVQPVSLGTAECT